MTTESQPTPALPTERQPAPTAKTDKPRTLVIWNPGAGGGGEGPEGRRAIERALDAHGVRVELFESPSEEATEERVDRAVSEGV